MTRGPVRGSRTGPFSFTQPGSATGIELRPRVPLPRPLPARSSRRGEGVAVGFVALRRASRWRPTGPPLPRPLSPAAREKGENSIELRRVEPGSPPWQMNSRLRERDVRLRGRVRAAPSIRAPSVGSVETHAVRGAPRFCSGGAFLQVAFALPYGFALDVGLASPLSRAVCGGEAGRGGHSRTQREICRSASISASPQPPPAVSGEWAGGAGPEGAGAELGRSATAPGAGERRR
jgi:hypothetical protein